MQQVIKHLSTADTAVSSACVSWAGCWLAADLCCTEHAYRRYHGVTENLHELLMGHAHISGAEEA